MQVDSHIDWLSVTAKQSHGSALHQATLGAHESVRAVNHYDTAKKYPSGMLVLSHSKRVDMGEHIIYSGKTLEALSHDVTRAELLSYHVSSGHNVSRVDIAIDLLDSGVTVAAIKIADENKQISTRAIQRSYVKETGVRQGEGYYIGNMRKRKKLLRCYDKALEQKHIGADWLRLELACAGTAARGAGKMLAADCSHERMVAMINGFTQIDIPALKVALSAQPTKIPLSYKSDYEASLIAAFKTIPAWIAGLQAQCDWDVLDAIVTRTKALMDQQIH